MVRNYSTYRKINESVLKRNKDKEIFNYKYLIKDAWRPLIKWAQTFQKINFDLENDDSLGEKKTILIKKLLREDQPIKYEFNCELFRAGGDWECPVLYFKVEFTHDYSVIDYNRSEIEYVFDDYKNKPKTNLSNCYVMIPGPEDGNHLVESKNGGFTAYTDESLKGKGLEQKDVKITEEDKKKAWKWLEETFVNLVEKRHKRLDIDEKGNVLKREDPSPTAPEGV